MIMQDILGGKVACVCLLMLGMTALFTVPEIAAQTVTGTALSIRVTGSNQINSPDTTLGVALGSGNSISAGTVLVVGNSNTANLGNGVVAGSSNTLDGLYYPNAGGLTLGAGNLQHGGGIVAGSSNYNAGYSDVLIGIGNSAGGNSDFVASFFATIGAYNSFIFVAQDSFAAGYNNYITLPIYDGSVYIDSATALGCGLINQWSSSTVIGCYNDSSIAWDSGLRFAVGNGSDSDHRSDALEVYQDGRILMPKQGDMPMGEFGLNGD